MSDEILIIVPESLGGHAGTYKVNADEMSISRDVESMDVSVLGRMTFSLKGQLISIEHGVVDNGLKSGEMYL